jgi:hypothetical protein
MNITNGWPDHLESSSETEEGTNGNCGVAGWLFDWVNELMYESQTQWHTMLIVTWKWFSTNKYTWRNHKKDTLITA